MNIIRMGWYALAVQMLWIVIGCCGDHSIITYEWTSLRATHLDNSGIAPLEALNGPLPAAAYGIRITLTDQPVARTTPSPISAAYATSCYNTYTYYNQDTVLALHIHALSIITGSTPQEVSDEFLVLPPVNSSPNLKESFLSIPELVIDLNNRSFPQQRIDLVRTGNKKPADDIRFIITLDLSGGKTLADTTTLITLQ